MARKRMIDPSIWGDTSISDLSFGARLCFVGMISNADDHGRIEASAKYIKGAIFRYDELAVSEVGAFLDEIKSCCRNVVFYEVDGRQYACFTNWRRYQYIQKPQPSTLPPPPERAEDDTSIVPVSYTSDNKSLSVSPNRIEKNRIEMNRERDAHTHAQSSPDSEVPHPVPKPEPDPNLKHPAVKAYRDAFKLTPSAANRALIAEQVTDLERWADTLTYWQQNTYRPESVGKILDRYQNGDPFQQQRNGRMNGAKHPPPQEDLTMEQIKARAAKYRTAHEDEHGTPDRQAIQTTGP